MAHLKLLNLLLLPWLSTVTCPAQKNGTVNQQDPRDKVVAGIKSSISSQNQLVTPNPQPVSLAPLIDFTFEGKGEGWQVDTEMSFGYRGSPSSRLPWITPTEWSVSDLPHHPAMPLGGNYWQDFDARKLLTQGAVGRGFYDSSIPNTATHISDRQGAAVYGGGGGRALGWLGTLTSAVFKIDQPFLQFLAGGSCPDGKCKILLQVFGTSPGSQKQSIVNAYTFLPEGPGGVLRRVVWDLERYKGAQARIVIDDQSYAGYIAADDFRFTASGVPIAEPTPKQVLWGIADTHSHPAAHLAFGGMYWGDPTWDPSHGKTPETTLVDCTVKHGWNGTGLESFSEGLGLAGLATQMLPHLVLGSLANAILPSINPQAAQMDVFGMALQDMPNNIPHNAVSRLSVNAIEQTLGHRTAGAKSGAHAYEGWPRFDSRTHQHMHEAWIRRAYDGGLRLMVAHVIETELIANLNPSAPGTFSNRSSVVNQVNWIKDMARRHADWAEIALSPADARRIIGQNKLAIVLGVEEDNIGDFGRPGGPAPTQENVKSYINDLYAMGVRHLFPIHLANNPMGGFALYNPFFDLNSFALNGSLPSVREGAAEGIFYQSLVGVSDVFGTDHRAQKRAQIRNAVRNKGFESLHLNGGLVVPLGSAVDQVFAFEDAHAADFAPAVRSAHGFANAQGLTPLGKFFVQQMIAKGMILDLDHMSSLSINDALALCEQEATESPDGMGYPANSGHSTFRTLSLTPSDREKTNLAHESDKGDDVVDRIRALGGMVSPIADGKAVKTMGEPDVPNSCPDSSAAWAQQYLYAIDRMGNRNVGLATDMALNGAMGPRFGPRAGYSFRDKYDPNWSLAYDGEVDDSLKPLLNNGTIYPQMPTPWLSIYGQRNPVAYTTPLTDWAGYRWEGEGGFTQKERDAFFACAAFLAGETPSSFEPKLADTWQMPVFGMMSAVGAAIRDSPVTLGLGAALDGRRKWMINVVKGLSRNSLSEVSNPVFGDSFGGPDIELAVLDVKQGRGMRVQSELPSRTIGFSYPNYKASYVILAKVFRLVKSIHDANQAPLVRSTLGARQFDFNYDGLAHYGLLPDMLQDLKNNGMTDRDFVPLFRSAEDYVRMWERCRLFTTEAKTTRRIQEGVRRINVNPSDLTPIKH